MKKFEANWQNDFPKLTRINNSTAQISSPIVDKTKVQLLTSVVQCL